ncbi:M23 family metallopeptidase [Sphingorhabdus contaminans]|uniref:M23 family metallopeptidase n=2 Tax=Sphingorhabdus contaminans TaxID=1343899 RepID=A0A553WH34_9SPHN|nr:M23 family metallopeptidase [Sphingorhabdus contaminans]
MPSVPITSGRSVDVRPMGNDRFRYAAPRNLMGPSIEGFGRALQGVANDIAEIEATYDDANKLELQNDLQKAASETRSSVLNLRGRAAADSLPDVLRDLDTRAEKLLMSARSPRARDMAKQAFDVVLTNNRELLTGHADKEMFAFKGEQLVAQRDQFAMDAVDLRGTELFDVNVASGVATIEKLARHNGWPDEQLAGERQKFIEGVYLREILAIDAEDGEPTRALARLDEKKNLISPDAEFKLRNSLMPRVNTAWARSEIQNIASSVAPAPTASAQPPAAGKPVAFAHPLRGAGKTIEGGKYGAPRKYGGHSGVDYASPPGTPAYAAAPGRVTRSYFDPAYGNRIEVDHGNGTVSTYSHLQARSVNVGDEVGPDTVLGGVGNTGSASNGSHLHYEVLRNGKKVDPSTVSVLAGVGGVPADPRLDAQAMSNAVEAYILKNKVSETRAEALRAETDRFVSNARSERAEAENDAARRVQDWMNKNKPGDDDLTSIGEIPAAIRSGISPAFEASLRDRANNTRDRLKARSDAAAAERVAATSDAAIFELQMLTDEQLMSTDLSRYRGRLKDKQLGPWVDRQQAIAKQGSGAVVKRDRITAILDSDLAKKLGASRDPDASDKEKRAWSALSTYVDKQVRGKLDKEVSREDIRSYIVAGMAEVEVKGTGFLGSNIGNESMPRAAVAPGATFVSVVPVEQKRKIQANFRARVGRDPTEAEVFDAYQSGKARGAWD